MYFDRFNLLNEFMNKSIKTYMGDHVFDRYSDLDTRNYDLFIEDGVLNLNIQVVGFSKEDLKITRDMEENSFKVESNGVKDSKLIKDVDVKFRVNDELVEETIKAKVENGILYLTAQLKTNNTYNL